jgi:hypothetical protein
VNVRAPARACGVVVCCGCCCCCYLRHAFLDVHLHTGVRAHARMCVRVHVVCFGCRLFFCGTHFFDVHLLVYRRACACAWLQLRCGVADAVAVFLVLGVDATAGVRVLVLVLCALRLVICPLLLVLCCSCCY